MNVAGVSLVLVVKFYKVCHHMNVVTETRQRFSCEEFFPAQNWMLGIEFILLCD